MVARPAVRKIAANADKVPSTNVGQAKPLLQKFRLKVDGQTKSSFEQQSDAETAGTKIKKAHPIVHVSIYDSINGRQTIIG